MEHLFNLKKRVHHNGLVEYRLYQKACSVGCAKVITKNENSFIDVPFEEKKLRVRPDLDADGWTVPVVPDNVSIQKSLKRTRDKVFDYANAVEWEWFCTFTFSEEKVNDRTDFSEVSSKMSIWLSNMRSRYCPDMQYVVVPEKHKNGAWHFHGLFANCSGLGFVVAVNNGKGVSFGKPLVRGGQQVYNISRYKLGFTDCTEIRDTRKVANYILKYITKEMVYETLGRKRYWNSKNLPKVKEEIALVNFEDFETFTKEFIQDLDRQKGNAELYASTVPIAHADFENKICYIKLE